MSQSRRDFVRHASLAVAGSSVFDPLGMIGGKSGLANAWGASALDGTTPVPFPAGSLIEKLPARCVGPAVNGRVSALAVYNADPRIFLVGSASGGVFKTEDGGKTFKAIFDRAGPTSMGDIAISQRDPNVVWIGTGEGWHRNDAGYGDGIYRSTDGGKTWANMGLPNSLSFGKVVIHPRNGDIVFAAVLGSAWGKSEERGVYKTSDGGKTWRRVLFVDDQTGASDLAIDPENPRNMLACMWDHIHRPYHYYHGGPGSGLYRSTDGGDTWHQVTKGLPATEKGRIAIDYHAADPRHVAAMVEVRLPHTGFYRSMDGGDTWTEMPAMPLDQEGKPKPEELNKHWGRPFYDNVLRYDPVDVDKIYHGNPWHFTADGGKTFHGWTADDHALWIDPTNPKHTISGGDRGVHECSNAGVPGYEASRPEPITIPPIGQFYAVGYDMRKLYWVMGGMQDFDCWGVPTQSRFGGVTAVDIEVFSGGDGQGTMADPEDWTTIYSLSAGGGLTRTNRRTGSEDRELGPVDYGSYTDPRTNAEYLKRERRLRTNPSAPLVISAWNNETLYFGANYLFKSVNRGDAWKVISPDLTHDKLEWQIPVNEYYRDSGGSWYEVYQAIRTISESPLKQGLLWVGTDDGYVHVTTDEGGNWSNVTANIPGLPEYSWISHVHASRFSEGRAYVTVDNHRNVDLATYVFMTDDYGKTWQKLNANLPSRESCYVITEGLKNPDLLFLGTEFSLWISLDRGQSWSRYQDWTTGGNSGYFPTVAVHDLAIHPRELDLIIGTHGRSIWTLPVRALEELTAENRAKDAYFVSPGNVYLFPTASYERQSFFEDLPGGFSRNTQPGTLFCYHLKEPAGADASIVLTDAAGNEIYAKLTGPAQQGLSVIPWIKVPWDMPIRRPGTYRAVLTIDGKEYPRTLQVEDVSDEDYQTAPPRRYPPNRIYQPPPRQELP